MKLLILLAIVAYAVAHVVKVPLTRVESRREFLMKRGLWHAHLKQKQLLRSINRYQWKAVGRQDVNDYDDMEYVGNITIGSEHDQEFVVVLDTGSSYLWIADVNCKTADCSTKRLYDPSKSKTYHKDGRPWGVSYGDGSNAKGFLGVDTITFGGINEPQLVVPKQMFGEATTLNGFSANVLDGILGLAFSALADDGVTPPFTNAIEQKLVDKDMFTVWMAHRGLQFNVRGGVFTYGDYDNENCGAEIAKVPLTSATYWQFRMDAVAAGNYKSTKGWDVMSDTGTSFIGGPPSIIQGIADALGSEFDSYNQLYVIDCAANNGAIELTIGGIVYSIEPANYIVEVNNNFCAIGMFQFDYGGWGPAWILGDPFIRQYCNMHYVTEEKIGFAPAIKK